MKKPSIEPDDGYEMDKDNVDHPFEWWEEKRVKDIDREYPGLMEYLDNFELDPVEEVVKPEVFDMVCRPISDIVEVKK